MTDIIQARAAVADRWRTEWVLLHSADPTDATYFPFCFERESFVEPTPFRPNGIDPQLWARISVRHTASGPETLGPPGARKVERRANIWVQIFGPPNVGAEVFDDAIKQAQTIFEGVSFSGISPQTGAVPHELGSDGRWFQVALIIPILYYETR